MDNMTMDTKINIDDTIKDMHNLGLNVIKLTPKLIEILSLKGVAYMKPKTPYRTGDLRRSIHAVPTINPTQIASGVNYAVIANVRSRHPGFIEKTDDYIEKIIPKESDIMIKQALREI